jgi:hypothetical protein
MTDQLEEINKRLFAIREWRVSPDGRCFTDDMRSRLSYYITPDSALDFFDHAPADIVWLLGEVERLLLKQPQ